LALIALGACQAAPPLITAPLTGSWGGRHIALELASHGGTLEYDCAAGTIDEPVRPDSAGRFFVHGTHTPGHGGPDRVGEQAPVLPADYEGRISGSRMTLSVRVVPSGLELGPFMIERGATPMVVRCL
jgi:hypothetical protein